MAVKWKEPISLIYTESICIGGESIPPFMPWLSEHVVLSCEAGKIEGYFDSSWVDAVWRFRVKMEV